MTRDERIHCDPYAIDMSADSCLSTRAVSIAKQRGMGAKTRQLNPHPACVTCPAGAARADELGEPRPPMNPHARRHQAPRLLPSTSLTHYEPRRR